jgi:hypothetical protein
MTVTRKEADALRKEAVARVAEGLSSTEAQDWISTNPQVVAEPAGAPGRLENQRARWRTLPSPTPRQAVPGIDAAPLRGTPQAHLAHPSTYVDHNVRLTATVTATTATTAAGRGPRPPTDLHYGT